MTTATRCRAHVDMTCPLVDPLEELLDELRSSGYADYVNPIDAAMGESSLVSCSHCGAKGEFDCVGMKREDSYRAFWTCRNCAHWVEV